MTRAGMGPPSTFLAVTAPALDGLLQPDEQGPAHQTCVAQDHLLLEFNVFLWGSQYRKYNIYDNISKHFAVV